MHLFFASYHYFTLDPNQMLSEDAAAAEDGEFRITGAENEAEKKAIIVKRLRHIEKTLKLVNLNRSLPL